MEMVKKISKYVLNILTIVNALIIGLSPVWGWNSEQIVQTISVVMAVISTYLLGNKAVSKVNEVEEAIEEVEDSFREED